MTVAAAPCPVVEDLMIRAPKTLPGDATVDEVRGVLADDHVHMVLLVSGGVLVGTVLREDLLAGRRRGAPALELSRLAGRTVAPGDPAERVRRRMVAEGRRRLAVVGPSYHLLGLLCLKRHRAGFCSEADVAARSCEREDAALLVTSRSSS